MRIALVDDDMQSLNCLYSLLTSQLEFSAKIDKFTNGEKFLSVYKPNLYDLIILDIFMGTLNGMAIAKRIREVDENVQIAFGSSSNEFASESYEVNACYYLRKPFTTQSINAMLDRLNVKEDKLYHTAKLPDGQVLMLRDVIYADFASHRIVFHCKHGNDVLSRVTFSKIESLLCAYSYFCSPFKGTIINFYEVSSQNGDVFYMSDGTSIPISRRKAKEVLEAYAEFKFKLLRKGGV